MLLWDGCFTSFFRVTGKKRTLEGLCDLAQITLLVNRDLHVSLKKYKLFADIT